MPLFHSATNQEIIKNNNVYVQNAINGYSKDVLIHIGFHKTGTTWMQNHLFESDNNAFEPLSLYPKGQSTLAQDFVVDKEGYMLSPFDGNMKVIQDELKNLFDKKPQLKYKIPIISHERLSGNPHAGGFDAEKISRVLQYVFPQAKVLITIREQSSFLLSNYFQYLKIGGTHSIDRYLNTTYDGKRPYFSPHHIDYRWIVANYFELFGRDRVLVLPYELFNNNPKNFLLKLGYFIGTSIDIDPDRVHIRMNLSQNYFLNYNLRFLNILCHNNSINNFSIVSNKPSKFIIKWCIDLLNNAIPDKLNIKTKNKIKDKISTWAKDRYSESNRQLNEWLSCGLESLGYFVNKY